MRKKCMSVAGGVPFLAAQKLLEMISLYPAPTDEEEPAGESALAKTLIRRLNLTEQLSQAAGTATEAAGEIGASPPIEANNPDAQANTVE